MSADADPIWGGLLLQLLLILLNAFFAATELAVLSLNENKLRRYIDQGKPRAQHVLAMVQSPSHFLSTIQVGITLCGFLGSAFAASHFAGRLSGWLYAVGVTFLGAQTLETVCVVLITLILSFFTLVFGELVPKRIAMQYAFQVASLASGVIRFITVAMKPVIWFLSATTNLVLRLLRANQEGDAEEITEEGIRMMVDIGEEKGTIEPQEAELIENIFEFNNQRAEDIMVHRTDVVAISVTDPPEAITATIRESGFSRFPVYDEDADDVIGTLATRDYLLNAQIDPPKPLRELIRPAYFVPETVRADVLFRDMQKKKTHLAIVVDEYGGTSGLITMEDLLEQIVGDIFDEFDPQEETEIQQLEQNLWRVSGGVDLETLCEALEIEMPQEEEFDTLGGLVYSRMTTIPDDGATPVVDVLGLHIQVEKIEDRRVESALVSKEPSA